MTFMASIKTLLSKHIYVEKDTCDQYAVKFVHISTSQHESSPSQNIGKLSF